MSNQLPELPDDCTEKELSDWLRLPEVCAELNRQKRLIGGICDGDDVELAFPGPRIVAVNGRPIYQD